MLRRFRQASKWNWFVRVRGVLEFEMQFRRATKDIDCRRFVVRMIRSMLPQCNQ